MLPGGNNFLWRSHAKFTLAHSAQHRVAWRVVPDDRTSSFVEFWLPHPAPGGSVPSADVQVTAPDGTTSGWISLGASPFVVPPAASGMSPIWQVTYDSAATTGSRPRITLIVAPTAVFDPHAPGEPLAPSGVWRIDFRNTGPAITVDGWVGRDDTPIGWPVLGRQAYFDDPAYTRFDHVGRHIEVDNPPGYPASYVHRFGTINGLATGSRTVVVSGVRRDDLRMARYSAAGPTVIRPIVPPPSPRVGFDPDAAAVCQDSPARHGILAAGSRSNSTVAMGGTSVAAPQADAVARRPVGRGSAELPSGHSGTGHRGRGETPGPVQVAGSLRRRQDPDPRTPVASAQSKAVSAPATPCRIGGMLAARSVAELDALGPVRDWFAAQGFTPFPFQEEVWAAYAAGDSGLVHAPTGMGKTYAAALGPIALGPRGSELHPPPLTLLWLTPLRALASDTGLALAKAARALNPHWTVDVRTGDTSSSVRAKQAQRLPTALVTTPESLTLMLSRADWRERFAHVTAVVCDEWHELMASKRGVQTELALARLRGLTPGLPIWGLSATLANLDEALACLVGPARARATPARTRIVKGLDTKTIEIVSALPATIDRFPVGRSHRPQDAAAGDPRDRARASPRWCSPTSVRRPKSGTRRCSRRGPTGPARSRCTTGRSSATCATGSRRACATAGCARWSARRASTSASTSRRSTRCCRSAAPRASAACCSARAAAATGPARSRASPSCRCRRSNSSRPPPRAAPPRRGASSRARRSSARRTCSSSISSRARWAAGSGRTHLRAEVRDTHAYANLADADWQWALDFVVHGGASLNAYPEYRRVVIGDDGVAHVPDRQIARRHRMGIGTIVSETSITVAFRNGAKLGQVEESFIAALRPGDCFAFAGRALEFIRVRELTAWVQPAKKTAARVPRWMGGKMALSSELADATRALIAAAKRGVWDAPEMQRVRPLLELQARWSALPGEREWLVEAIATREGHGLFFYPFEGRLAHFGLATLFSYRLGAHTPATFSITANDYGFGLVSPQPVPLSLGELGRLLAAPGVERDILGGTQRDGTRPPPLPRDRARRGTHLPGLPRPAASAAAAAGVERAPLQRVRRVRPRQSAARAGGARGAGAPAGGAAPDERRSRGCAGAARC